MGIKYRQYIPQMSRNTRMAMVIGNDVIIHWNRGFWVSGQIGLWKLKTRPAKDPNAVTKNTFEKQVISIGLYVLILLPYQCRL